MGTHQHLHGGTNYNTLNPYYNGLKIDQHFHSYGMRFKESPTLNCSPNPPAAPLSLASLWQGGGNDGTSPPAAIGHPRHRPLLLDATRHGSGIETQGRAGDRVMQSLEKTPKRVWPSDKSIANPFTQSTPHQGEGFS